MFAWYAVTILWSENIPYTLRYLFYMICGISIILAALSYAHNIDRLSKLVRVLGVIFTIELILGLLESFTSFRLPVSPYSEYVSFFGRTSELETLSPEVEIESLERSATGFEWNPNNMAIAMEMVFPFFLFYRKIWVKVIGFLAILAIVIFSSSRGVFIALSFMLAIYLVLYKKSIKMILLMLVGFIGLLVINYKFNLKESDNTQVREIAQSFDVLGRFLSDENASPNPSESINVRKDLMNIGIGSIQDSYGIGIGGGCSTDMLENMGGVGKKKITSLHNFWLEVSVEGGILFVLLFFAWYANLFLELFSIANRAQDPRLIYLAKATSLGLAGFLIGAISASTVIYFFPMWLLFGVSIAVVNCGRMELQSSNQEPS